MYPAKNGRIKPGPLKKHGSKITRRAAGSSQGDEFWSPAGAGKHENRTSIDVPIVDQVDQNDF